ncbi:MAG: cobyric acid synthase [Solirubrobacteraceae bacterium]
MTGGLLVAGTQSEAGKSLVAAGICRWLHRRGVRVAPFKAQNMALNSAVTPGGAEIGRAQVVQAAAAGVPAEAAMNPVLIKPSGERHSQVVLMGRPHADACARSYQEMKHRLREPVLAAFEDLRSRFDVVICEGAGSPAEINLRAGDLANMGLARAADLPVVVVGDIDRGGVFASFLGTLALLEPADQALVAGFLVNKFRGDPGILAPGLEQIRTLTGRPVLGTLPFREDLGLDAEDSLALDKPRPEPVAPVDGGDTLEVAVLRLRWTSNFTDVDPLSAEPGVSVRFTRSPADVERADLVLVPGTKATVEDLERLRASGLATALERRARAGQPILGVCGGYQMLGGRIEDRVESGRGEVRGLGLLPVATEFATDKLVRQVAGTFIGPGADGVPACGYEIRHGRPIRRGGTALVDDGSDSGEGCADGPVIGTSWHGLLEGDEVRRGLLGWVADRRGRSWTPGSEAFATVRERHLDRLGDLIEEHADTDALLALIERGAPPDLPMIAPGGALCSSS